MRAILLLAMVASCASDGHAQGTVSAGIHGSVRGPGGVSTDGARVRAVNTATGFVANAQVRHGRFLLPGLEPGGPYVVEVLHEGYRPQQSAPLLLRLGEPLELAFLLQPETVALDPIRVAAVRPGAAAGGGTATTIPEPLLRQLPTLNRNFYDFVALAPQVSTKVGFGRSGVSAAGANLRFNSFLVNGADERMVNGSVAAAHNVGKSVPLDAVKEYQVLVAPYDVRYGDFAGALVNTVTHSGTNELRGSAFAYWRNDHLARNGAAGAAGSYDRLQYGWSLAGPLLRDRLHFLVASELQRLTEPAPGPYAGQPASAPAPLPVSEGDLVRFQDIMQRRYGLTAGAGGRVINGTPLHNLFARVDAAIPEWNTRALAFVSDVRTESEQFSRSAAPDTFALSSYQYASESGLRLMSLQIRTDLPRIGVHNELLLASNHDRIEQVPAVRQPLVRVLLPGVNGGQVVVAAGSADPAHGRFGRSRSVKLRDELSMPWGSHLLAIGVQIERFSIRRGGVNGAYGIWTFVGLDALELGAPERFVLPRDFGSASTPLRGQQLAFFVGDEWRPIERLSVTIGLRADRLEIDGRAPYNPAVDSIFGRRTDEMPRPRFHISPRLGFTWDLPGTRDDQLRGGAGVFTGRPPLAWFVPLLSNHGVGNAELRCGFRLNDHGPPPDFVPDYRAAPTRCGTGSEAEPRRFGDVDLAARDLRLAQSLRGSLAYVRRLPLSIVATAEAVGTRYLSDFMFVNLNLPPPGATDRFGRVIYGRLNTNGTADSTGRSPFTQVIELRNTSRNYSRQLSARLERRVAHGLGGALSYTYSQVRDVQSPSRVNLRGIAMWADARAVSGRHDDLSTGISLNDLPHRVLAAATYAAPRPRWPTSVALYYLGESGSPFTYLATGIERRGDLNADGSSANDPIYVPRSAFDTSEIRFQDYERTTRGADGRTSLEPVTATEQAEAFERFIEGSTCLRRQRGRILGRNSCREPWTHTTIASVRQGIPLPKGAVEAELDAFNVLNLLHRSWGRYRVARPRILEHVAQTSGSAATSQPVFRFDTTRQEWETLATESSFQLQLALRYRF